MIHLLYLVPAMSNPGGMERILTEKINYLISTGQYSITVMTTEQLGKPFYFQIHPSVNIINLDLDFNQYFSQNLVKKYLNTKKLLRKYKKSLESFILHNKVDVCISLGGKELEFLNRLNVSCKRVCELHFSINIREQFILARGNTLIHKLIGKLRTYQLINSTQYLDKLVVLTKKDEEKLKKTHNNVLQIYNFSPISTIDKAFLNDKIIVAVGKLDPQKGFDLLIKACKYIRNWNGWKLHIYGQGPDKEMLENEIERLNLQQYIFFKGITHNMDEVYKNASIFVLSSRYEGFPMVLVEALSYGLPVVSFDCETGPSEVITNQDCGILIENGNSVSLGYAIQDLINNPDIIRQKSLVSLRKSREFSKKNIMSQWISLFNNLVKNESNNR